MATPQEILAESQCTVCSGTASLFESAAITILKQITGMTQAQIEAESPCWLCYGLSQSQAAMLVLLNSIAGATGSGATTSGGVVNPEGVVVANQYSLYYNSANDTFWVKRTGSGNNTGWSQLI